MKEGREGERKGDRMFCRGTWLSVWHRTRRYEYQRGLNIEPPEELELRLRGGARAMCLALA